MGLLLVLVGLVHSKCMRIGSVAKLRMYGSHSSSSGTPKPEVPPSSTFGITDWLVLCPTSTCTVTTNKIRRRRRRRRLPGRCVWCSAASMPRRKNAFCLWRPPFTYLCALIRRMEKGGPPRFWNVALPLMCTNQTPKVEWLDQLGVLIMCTTTWVGVMFKSLFPTPDLRSAW